MKFQDVPLPPSVKRLVLVPFRLLVALKYFSKPLLLIFSWLWNSKETSNFTYDLSVHNRHQLIGFLSVITQASTEKIASILSELDEDQELRNHINRLTAESAWRYKSDAASYYGKRLGWYALIRILKPKVVVETGIDKGLGTIVMASALLRNLEEGAPSIIYGIDINPKAGFLVQGKYAQVTKLLFGDSLKVLSCFDHEIDLFINDSDHSEVHEAAEYELVLPKLSDGGVIVGDNAHVSDKLFEFSIKSGRNFLFFQERPKDHWYPGCGIGVSFKKADK